MVEVTDLKEGDKVMIVACVPHMLPHLNQKTCDCAMLGRVTRVLVLYDKSAAWNVCTTIGHYFKAQLRLISRPAGSKRNDRNR